MYHWSEDYLPKIDAFALQNEAKSSFVGEK